MKRIFLILIFFTISMQPVHAYIDPGSGSAITSLIIGFFVAIGVLLKTFWYRIKSILGLSRTKKEQDNEDTEK